MNNEYMTNSILIKGYATSGGTKYSAYGTQSRVSHAHGWSTAPTTLLSTLVAGLQIDSAMGTTWTVAPQPGDLTSVEVGFTATLGVFNITLAADGAGSVSSATLCTPDGTSGVFDLGSQTGTLTSADGTATSFDSTSGSLGGGCWSFAASLS